MSRNTQYQCLNCFKIHGTKENDRGTGVHHESKEDYVGSQRVQQSSREVFCSLPHACSISVNATTKSKWFSYLITSLIQKMSV